MNEYKFWMVFVDGGNSPTAKHYEKTTAIAEAERLAIKTTKQSYVMECVERFVMPTPSVSRYAVTECAPMAAEA